MELTYNKPSKSDTSTLQVGLILEDDPSHVVKVNVPNSGKQTKGWTTASLDLSAYAGQNIAAFGLVFDPNGKTIEDYQMNIGEIRIFDGSAAKPDAPTGFHIAKSLTNTDELVVEWDMEDYSKVKQYNLYENGSYVGGIYDSTYYIKSLKNRSGKLSIRAVGADGRESEPATLSYNLDAAVQDIQVKFNKQGHATVSWKYPKKTKGKEAIELTLQTEYTNKPFTKTIQVKKENLQLS